MNYNRHNLACIKIAAKAGGVRPQIEGIRFIGNKTVATDSYRLIEVDSVEGAARVPFTLTHDAIKGIRINKKETIAIGDKGEAGGPADAVPLMTMAGAKMVTVSPDDEYPQYDQFFKKDDTPAVVVHVNGELLAGLLTLMADMNATGDVVMKLYGKNDWIILEGGSADQKARAVIMPVMS